ncbi:hypothetical protein ACLK1W_15505 [Escherichia coli]
MKPLTRRWLPNSSVVPQASCRPTGPLNLPRHDPQTLQANPAKIATRKASRELSGSLRQAAAQFMGGSADLAPSNLTMWSGSKSLTPESAAGNYIHYGVREFAMSAIMERHRPARWFHPLRCHLPDVRWRTPERPAHGRPDEAARHLLVYTHDSIGLGEDGRITSRSSRLRPCV